MTIKITPEYLAELRQLANVATPGPWRLAHQDTHVFPPAGGDRHVCICGMHYGDEPNMKFIAASRTAIPALLDHIEKLEAMMPHRCDLCHYWAEKDGNYVCLKNNDFSRCWACWDGCNKWQLKEVK